jgi:hypothetical protein
MARYWLTLTGSAKHIIRSVPRWRHGAGVEQIAVMEVSCPRARDIESPESSSPCRNKISRIVDALCAL